MKLLFRYLSNNTIIQVQNKKNMNDIFKALNDPARREILKMLQKQDMTAGDIASQFEMTAPSISHHLDKLKRAGLVTTIKKGQYIHYSINTTIIDDLLNYILTLKK
jgi:DNA-binding transcriptional ArsR family regulator